MKQKEVVGMKKGKCIFLWREPVGKKVIKWLRENGQIEGEDDVQRRAGIFQVFLAKRRNKITSQKKKSTLSVL